MLIARNLGIAIALTMFWIDSGSAYSQTKGSTQDPRNSDPGDSGHKQWIVERLWLREERVDKVVDVESEEKAKSEAKVRNDATPNSDTFKYYYSYVKRPIDDPGPDHAPITPQGRTPVVNPKMSTVDAKPAAAKPKVQLVGKKYSGTIGSAKVAIEFQEKTFIVSGDLSGNGTWEATDTGVVMETSMARYRGFFSGNRISGIRTLKDKNGQDEWNVELVTVVEPFPMMGTYRMRQGENNAFEWTFTIRDDNTFKASVSYKDRSGTGNGQWKVEGGRMYIRWENVPDFMGKIPGKAPWIDVTNDYKGKKPNL